MYDEHWTVSVPDDLRRDATPESITQPPEAATSNYGETDLLVASELDYLFRGFLARYDARVRDGPAFGLDLTFLLVDNVVGLSYRFGLFGSGIVVRAGSGYIFADVNYVNPGTRIG
jgi:hypothetical protein